MMAELSRKTNTSQICKYGLCKNKEGVYSVERYVIDGRRVIDLFTGENLGILHKEVPREQKAVKVNGGKGWIKSLHYPAGLTKTQSTILSYVAQHPRIRKGDNAVICANRTVASTKQILDGAGVESYNSGIKALYGLKKRGILCKDNNIWYLNPYIAYKSFEGGAIKLSTLDLFESFRYGNK